MKSWTNWVKLNTNNVNDIPTNAKGVYVIRAKKISSDSSSDIIYIGSSGTGAQGIKVRLNGLCKGLECNDETSAKKRHHASWKIREYKSKGLEFSWIQSSKYPGGVEKALLLAYFCSVGKLPKCNSSF